VSWVIENAIVRRAHAAEAKRLLRELFEAMLSSCEIAAAVVSRATGMKVAQETVANRVDQKKVIIAAGQRDRATEYLRQWLGQCAHDYLWICDPYFGPRDLEILQLVLECKRDLRVTVVSSRKQQNDDHVTSPADDYYVQYWRKNFSDQAPPTTEFVIVGTRSSGDLPIHDRWWLSKDQGLRIGTSFNGLGVSRDSEICPLSDSEIREREAQTLSYINHQKREHLGDKLTYQFFEI
jgi:hypothetical protein